MDCKFLLLPKIEHFTNVHLTATYLPSWKLSKLDEPDMQDTAGEAVTSSLSDVLLWTPSHDRAKAGRSARTYIQQLCKDTGCSPDDLPEATNDREEWREKVSDIRRAAWHDDDDDDDDDDT